MKGQNEDHLPAAGQSDQRGLIIRAVRPSDVEGIAVLENLPGVRAGTLRLPYQSIDETKQRVENRPSESVGLVAIIDGAIVGNAGLTRFKGRRNHAAGIGMGVHDNFTGRGIGGALLSELIDVADNWLNIKRLELTVYTDNAHAIRLYQRFGFENEGLLKAFGFRAGSYVDAYAMGRLRR